MEVSKEQILSEFNDLLEKEYNGSFTQMVCDYIQDTGMKKKEVEKFLNEIKNELNQYDCKRMNTNQRTKRGRKRTSMTSDFLFSP